MEFRFPGFSGARLISVAGNGPQVSAPPKTEAGQRAGGHDEARLWSDAMFLDWLLASFHHLAVFSLAAILATELALTSSTIDDRIALRLARVDAWFGLLAAVALAAGLLRIFLAAKGLDYYLSNAFFWIKMALFVTVGVVSAAPTYAFIKWRRAVRADPGFRPSTGEVMRLRRILYVEAALFALIPVAAAAMARGYGMY
jgi:putative membrane protein